MTRKMTDPIQAIQYLLQCQYCEIIENNSFELEENKQVRFTITKSPDNGLKLSIPAGGKAHSGIIESKTNYKKSCDFLIVVPQNENNIDIYFLEIKETLHPDENGIPVQACKQILFTTPVWEYLNSMMRTHFDIRPEITKHFVVLAEKELNRLDKQLTKLTKSQSLRECQYRGKNFKVIRAPEAVSFSNLKCQTQNP